jgi:hypothetical protein
MDARSPCIERVSRIALLGAGALVLVTLVAAVTRGRLESPWANLYQLTPLLGGTLGLARLAARPRAKPERATVVYLLFCLALLCWGGSGVWRLTETGATPIPSLGDLGYYAGGLAWTIGAWVLYEGVTPDFLTEVEANSYLLSMLTLATVFVLSVAGGADLVASLKTGGNPLQLVALTFPLLYGFNALMLVRLARRRQGATLLAGQVAIKLVAAGLGVVYLAQMALETTLLLAERTSGTLPPIRNAPLPASLYALAFFVLTLGVLRYPLVMPVVGARPPEAAPCPKDGAP